MGYLFTGRPSGHSCCKADREIVFFWPARGVALREPSWQPRKNTASFRRPERNVFRRFRWQRKRWHATSASSESFLSRRNLHLTFDQTVSRGKNDQTPPQLCRMEFGDCVYGLHRRCDSLSDNPNNRGSASQNNPSTGAAPQTQSAAAKWRPCC